MFFSKARIADIEDALNFISNQKTETAKHYKLRKGVTLKVEQELIGTVMYKYKKKNEKECIIGYSIGRAYWGKGLGRRIVKNLIDSLRAQGKVSIIKAWVHIENMGSQRVLEINEFSIFQQDEFPKIKEILFKLAHIDNKELIILNEELNNYLNCGLAPLITEKKFRYVECKKCNKKYLPEEIEVLSWMVGQDLCAEGGEKLIDPNNHCLAVIFQWNS